MRRAKVGFTRVVLFNQCPITGISPIIPVWYLCSEIDKR